eukprot:gnl/Chilomastix_cuspidata/457.p1 GENE.gnl/Chilomastix_cuspidata/457~~gnl/Chilomastix_cuspidata/457.p1  ORF type:complete len:1004 (+),score=405.29 gnl/Chilomastix_cuspidata/457:2829-5840(+)
MAAPKVLTAKEIKKLVRPTFEANPDRYYPSKVFAKWGFSRAQCPKCKHFYWRHTEAADTCGDSACKECYSFIGKPLSTKKRDHPMTPAEAWANFRESFERTDPPHTALRRYPVVARWRDDCEFTAAGIQCYQPYCVTGEVAPPANPLIQTQFCFRFNDLDSIGLSGRHYSGFTMIGIQVFNTPEDHKYWSEELVEFNIRWLVDGLGIPLDEITLIEDVWAGGGNLGPCVEYFIGGLEIGNMVLMQFKTFPDGSREELSCKVVDVGIGLERIPWLINGGITSYPINFKRALDNFVAKVNASDSAEHVDIHCDAWKRFAPYSCLLNVDELDSVDEAWRAIAKMLGMDSKELRGSVELVRDAYIVLDHTRTVLVALTDGALPGNVGGGSNIRTVLRRAFHILRTHGWLDAIGGTEGIAELMEIHRNELEEFHGSGSFPKQSSTERILELEFKRWHEGDIDAKKKLERIFNKKRASSKTKEGPFLSMDDWIVAVTTFGLAPARVTEIVGEEPPETLFREIAEREERIARTPLCELYDTSDLPPTDSLIYGDETCDEWTNLVWSARPVAAIANADRKTPLSGRLTMLALDRSAFYPLSGGQDADRGALAFFADEAMAGEPLAMVGVTGAEKAGSVVLHHLERPLDEVFPDFSHDTLKTLYVRGTVDEAYRRQLIQHHTGAHILNAAARTVLGAHVWQAGAQKKFKKAHLDITHFSSLTPEEEVKIEHEANRLILQNLPVTKRTLPKSLAEKRFGFTLYQGGVVPGNSVRVVAIGSGFGPDECDSNLVDVEACCGTHAPSTGVLGSLRIVKSTRISDGVVRIHFVAGAAALKFTQEQSDIVHTLQRSWGIEMSEVVPTADRFFSGYKMYKREYEKQLVELSQLRIALDMAAGRKLSVIRVNEEVPTMYFSLLPQEVDAHPGKGVVVVAPTFVIGALHFFGKADEIKAVEDCVKAAVPAKARAVVVRRTVRVGKGKKARSFPNTALLQVLRLTGAESGAVFDALSTKFLE